MSSPFDVAFLLYMSYVTCLARKLAQGERDAVDDLTQDAWFAVLLTSVARWAEEPYMRTVIARRVSVD